MSLVRDSSKSVPGSMGGGGERTARTAVPVARPRTVNIAAGTQRGRLRRGGRSLWEVVGVVCCSRSSRDEVEKPWEQ